jgi:hypothetical protein
MSRRGACAILLIILLIQLGPLERVQVRNRR